MQTIIIGHRNPDMDSVCSALAYAHLKRVTCGGNVIAGRAGNTNERIDFVLEKFGVESPTLFTDLSPKVRDVMQTRLVRVLENEPVHEAMMRMESRRLRGLPVVNAAGQLRGLISGIQISKHLFPHGNGAESLREVHASPSDIVEAFHGRVLADGPAMDSPEDLFLMIAAMSARTFAERFQRYEARRIILLVGDREGILTEAIRHRVRAIVVTGGMPVRPDLVNEAARAGVAVVSSPHDTATTVLLARGAVAVGRMLDAETRNFHPDTALDEAREIAAASSTFVFPVVDDDGTLVGVLSKSDFLKAVPRQLILVDHNELSQAVRGADRVPIVEILDHHRVGGFSSPTPMLFWNNPVGSTCTIVALCYEQAGVEIPPPLAGVLMSGLISDTLNLSSPTATPTDARILQMLATRAGCDAGRLAEEIFSVGSPLLTMTAEQAVGADCKEYEEGGARFSVSQIEELSFDRFAENESKLLSALEALRAARGYRFAALLITDINRQNSILLLAGDEALLQRIDYPMRGPGVWRMDGIVSRKKQLLPYLIDRLSHAGPPRGDA